MSGDSPEEIAPTPRAPMLAAAAVVVAGALAGRAGISAGSLVVVGLAIAAGGAAMGRRSGTVPLVLVAFLTLAALFALAAQRAAALLPAEPPPVVQAGRFEACLREVVQREHVVHAQGDVLPAGGGEAFRARLTLPARFDAPPPAPGDRIRVRGETRAAPPAANPGEADPRRRDADRGVEARLDAEDDWVVVGRCPRADGVLVDALATRRRAFRRLVESILPAPEAGVALAMTTGETDAIVPEDGWAFRQTGTVHVLSISGLHLSLVVGVVYGMARRAALRFAPGPAARFDVRIGAAALAFGAAALYAGYAGLGTATARALVATALAMAAYGAGTRSEAWNAWAAGIVVLVIADPPAVTTPSFALTFTAVAGILCIARPAGERRTTWRRRAHRMLVDGVRTTLAASVATAPLVAWWFGRVPAGGMLANAGAIPLLGWCALLPLLAAAVAHPLCEPLARVLVILAWPALAGGRALVAAFAAAPLASIATPCGGLAAAAFGVASASALLLSGRARVAGVIAGMLAGALALHAFARPPRSLEVTFLSVGQGDSAVIRFPDGAVMVIDAGPPGAGNRVVVPFLRSAGVRFVDVLVLTHAHPDHVGGASELAEAMPIGELWIPGPLCDDPILAAAIRALARRGAGLRFVGTGSAPFVRGENAVTPLAPDRDLGLEGPGESAARNDRSLVLRVSGPGLSVLFAGDLEEEGEAWLVEQGPLRADVVKVPHHGSRTSSGTAFVQATSPSFAIVSSGVRNPFGFPHADVVSRWESAGAHVLRTDRSGAITVRSCPAGAPESLRKRGICASSFFDTLSGSLLGWIEMDRRGKVLVVDDDGFSRTLYGDMLAEAGHEVTLSAGGIEALELLRNKAFDAVVTDLVMPEITGLQILETARSLARQVDVIIVTGHATVRNAVTALRSGAFDYITKPVDPDELKVAIQRLLSQQSLLDENRELKSYVGLFRRCQAIASCLDGDQIARIAVESLVEELGGVSGVFLAAPTEKEREKDKEREKEKGAAKVEERAPRGMQGKVHRALTAALGGDPLAFSSVQTLDAKTGGEVSTKAKLSMPLGPSIVVPVRAGSAVYGALFVGRKPDGAVFGFSELGKADFFGKQIGLALDNASKYDEAKELAYTDDLTELYNVRYLNFILDKEIKRARRYTTPLTVLFMDLDYFKGVNDRHGHLTGSRMLIEVAAVIKRCVRDTDVLVRYGGDEYTVLLPNTDSGGAVVVAERIRSSIEQTDFPGEGGVTVKITASIGVASFPEHAREKRDILRMADAAMYHGKATSRNVVYLASALLDPTTNAEVAAARAVHADENRDRRAKPKPVE